MLRELPEGGGKHSRFSGSNTVRKLRTAVPFLALFVVVGCSSSEGKDEELLTELRKSYCLQLGVWQTARNAGRTAAPESSEAEEAELAADGVLLAMRPLRDETVRGGQTLGEETVLAISNGDGNAEGHVVQYCGDVGFETLTR
ncbi:hypothetical protein [Streptomyces sp. NPDC003832]